jgi:hypothetical protein
MAMTEVHDKSLKALRDFLDSPEGKASMREFAEKMANEQKIAEGRYKKFEKYLETHDFDKLMYRLILENGDKWQDKCYKRGYEPYPNNKLRFVIDYLVHNYEPIEVSEIEPKHFPSTIYFFKGYYFQTICGQGCFHRIYKKDMQMVLQV